MMSKALIPLAVSAIVFFCLAMSFAQEDHVRLDNYVFEKPAMPPALFDHDAHNEKAGIDDCAICHHVIENGKLSEFETSEDRPCVECHGLSPSAENAIALRRAYHLRCKGCHLDRESGPIMCGGCHSRGV